MNTCRYKTGQITYGFFSSFYKGICQMLLILRFYSKDINKRDDFIFFCNSSHNFISYVQSKAQILYPASLMVTTRFAAAFGDPLAIWKKWAVRKNHLLP